MRVYATYNGTKDIRPEFAKEGKAGKLQLVWSNVRNDAGLEVGEFYSNPANSYKGVRKGHRYMIEFKSLDINRIKYPTKVKKINKNLRCNITRKIGDDFIFIKGKFKGKKFSDIENRVELSSYLIWMAENSYNEATVINSLAMLKKLHDEK